ncbi:MAG: DUF1565 domain-containing protein, partial [Candidatus Shapirobacteria bacterium]
VTVNLPAVSATRVGKRLTIIDVSGSATAANPIALTPNGANTIDGVAAPLRIVTAYGAYTLTCVQTGAATYGWVSERNTVLDALNAQVTIKKTIIYVDGSRPDAFASDGSPERPYRTIAEATAVAVAGDEIKLAPGTYAVAVVLPAGVSLIGNGVAGAVIINNTLTTGIGPFAIQGIIVNLPTAINGNCVIRDSSFLGGTVIGDCTVRAFNTDFIAAGAEALIFNHANAALIHHLGTIATTGGGHEAILGSLGASADFVNSNISTDEIARAALDVAAPGPIIRMFDSVVTNSAGGSSITTNHGALITDPNVFHHVLATGAVNFNADVTSVDDLAGGAIAGTAVVYHSSWEHFESWQHTAAGETLRVFRALRAGRIIGVTAEVGTAAAVGESMTFDVEINGVTCLTAVITIDSVIAIDTPVAGVLAAAVNFAAGNLVRVVRAYVPGVGPTPMLDTVVDILVQHNN